MKDDYIHGHPGRPRRWDIEAMKEFCHNHGLKVIPLTSFGNVRTLNTWKCTACGSEFQCRYDTVLVRNRVQNGWNPCMNCKRQKFVDHANPDAITRGDATSAYLSGFFTGRTVGQKDKSKLWFSAPNLQTANEICQLIETAAQPKTYGQSYSVAIRNNPTFRLSVDQAIGKIPADSKLAAAWIRGYFVGRGRTEAYDEGTSRGVRRLTIYGEQAILQAILDAFAQHVGGHASLQRHKRRANTKLASTIYELHVFSRKHILDFLGWIFSDPTLPPPNPKLVAFMDDVRQIMEKTKIEEKTETQDPVVEFLIDSAAKAVLAARETTPFRMAMRLDLPQTAAYAVKHDAPSKVQQSTAKVLKSAFEWHSAFRHKAQNEITQIAALKGLSYSSARKIVYDRCQIMSPKIRQGLDARKNRPVHPQNHDPVEQEMYPTSNQTGRSAEPQAVYSVTATTAANRPM